MNTNVLKLIRFCGEEYFPIIKATWSIDKGEDGNEFSLEIDTGEGIKLCEDTKDLNAEPNWELTYTAKNLHVNDLIAGFKAEIPNGYNEDTDDYATNFYYCEHEETDNNLIEILKVDGNKLYIRVTGEIQDVNYYDGSKPKNKIVVETWFENDE